MAGPVLVGSLHDTVRLVAVAVNESAPTLLGGSATSVTVRVTETVSVRLPLSVAVTSKS